MKKMHMKGEIAPKSKKVHMATGGGSRPGKIGSGRVKTPTSNPSHPHELGRAPSGWLK